MRHTAIALLAIGTLASAPALATERAPRDHYRASTIEMLEDRDAALQRRTMDLRIGAVERREIAEQRDTIDEMIDDLEEGKSIDRHELDGVLGRPYHYHYHHLGYGHGHPYHG